MKCDRCGYDDHGTGDFSHVCADRAAASALPPSPPGQPTYWLVEAVSSPMWWDGRFLSRGIDPRHFTTDPNLAIKFASKADALRVCDQSSSLKATEHIWIDDSLPPGQQRRTVSPHERAALADGKAVIAEIDAFLGQPEGVGDQPGLYRDWGAGQPEGCELPPLPKPVAIGWKGAGMFEIAYGYTESQVLRIRAEGIAAALAARQAPAVAPKGPTVVNSDFVSARMFLAAFPESFFESDESVDRTTFAHAVDHLDGAIKLVDRLDGYARSLAMHLWREHYIKTSPQFDLCDDAYGVLSQIDNMITGLVLSGRQVGAPDTVRDAALEAEALICDAQANEPECPERASYCAEAIRALKGPAQ